MSFHNLAGLDTYPVIPVSHTTNHITGNFGSIATTVTSKFFNIGL